MPPVATQKERWVTHAIVDDFDPADAGIASEVEEAAVGFGLVVAAAAAVAAAATKEQPRMRWSLQERPQESSLDDLGDEEPC